MADVEHLVAMLAESLVRRGEMLATAESCTGGGVAVACTGIAGSSTWFERGFVTYSNRSKQEMLGVPNAIIEQYGAVSEQTVAAMVDGALAHSQADWAVAISGIAGPGGGSADKPVGTVWIGWGGPHGWRLNRKFRFSGDRRAVRAGAVECALQQLTECCAEAR
jgi:nicotinamide-nucleotide amidase